MTFTPYTAQEAKASADAYYLPLIQIFDYIKTNAAQGMYAVTVSGTELSTTQLDVLQKCGYKVTIDVDGANSTKYQISWNS